MTSTKEIILLLFLSFLSAATFSLIKIGGESIPPVTLIAVRSSIAATILYVVLSFRGIQMPRDRRAWCMFLVQSCCNTVIPFTLIAWAQQRIDAATSVILVSSSPFFIYVINATVLRWERSTIIGFLGIFLGFGGVWLTISGSIDLGQEGSLIAQLLILAAAFCFACSALLGRQFSEFDPLVPAAGSLICGSALLIPASMLVDKPWSIQPTLCSIQALLILSIFSTALAFVIFFRLVQTLGPMATSAQAYLRVPFGVAIATTFLNEEVSPTAWTGVVLLLLGVAAMIAASRQQPAGGKI